MKQLLLLTGCALILAACQIPAKSYSRMSAAEIAAHNAVADTWDQVHCVEEIRVGSHIPKRHCMSLREMQDGNANQVGVLNALSTSGSGLSAF